MNKELQNNKFIDSFYEKRDFKLKAYCKKDGSLLDNFTIMQTAFNDNVFSLLYRVLNEDNFIPIFFTEKSDKDNKDLYEYDVISIKDYDTNFYIKKIKEEYKLFLFIDLKEKEKTEIFSLDSIEKQNITRLGNLFDNLEITTGENNE